ncbi:MAG: hypothetical protein NZ556_02900 [Fimbriimonadales bacterium]|nr:hypothetical protein [Fimbriimonadales bacterium]
MENKSQVIHMRRFPIVLGIIAAASLLAWGWLQWDSASLEQAQEKFLVKTLFTETGGYVLTPPEFVAPPFIRRIMWSPDGSYAVLVQTQVLWRNEGQYELQHRVLMWSRKTKRVSVVWESQRTPRDALPDDLLRVEFFKDTPACILTISPLELPPGSSTVFYSVYYAPLGGRVVKLGEFAEAQVIAPPKDAARYLMWSKDDPATPQREQVYAPILPGGRLGEVRPVLSQISPETPYYMSVSENWDESGTRLLVTYRAQSAVYDEAGNLITPTKFRTLLWDPRTNTVQEIDRMQFRRYAPPKETNLRVEHAPLSVREAGAQGETHTAWLAEDEQAMLFAADSTLSEVAPKGDGILYVAHGAAFYRSIVRLDAEQARALKEQLQRAKYLEQARRIATALMMYAQDYDETFPPRFDNEYVAFVLSPYLRDENAFKVNGSFAFRYLLDGHNLANLSSHADTEVGYLELPDGRAVIYADGHVKWQPKQ